jgi:hypothetical protein
MITDMMLFILGGFGNAKNLVIKKDRQPQAAVIITPPVHEKPGKKV